jgi:hypothetical protein
MKNPHKHFSIRNKVTGKHLNNHGGWNDAMFREQPHMPGTRFWKNLPFAFNYMDRLTSEFGSSLVDLEVVDATGAIQTRPKNEWLENGGIINKKDT